MRVNLPATLVRPRLLATLGLGILSACVASNQSGPSEPLSMPLRAHITDGRFDVVTSVRGLPLGIRDELQVMFGTGTLDIADPGAEFQTGDAVVTSKLPTRRLIAAGCSTTSYCLVYYERGGSSRTWRVALFHWTPAATQLEWGGTAPGGFKTIDEVRRAVLAGRIGGPAESW